MKTSKSLRNGFIAGFIIAAVCSAALLFAEDDNQGLLQQAAQCLIFLKNKDFKQLSKIVHPKKGVSFSPYAYVSDGDINFNPAKIKNLKLTDKYLWGYFDGSGAPMELSVEEYFNRFVFNHDFTQAPHVGINRLVKTGNTVSNLDRAYPGASFVEYHFPGFEAQYEGIDWASLRLVFEKTGNKWMLVGIVHDCWTI